MFYSLNEPNLRLIKNPYVTLLSFAVFFFLVFFDISADVVQGAPTSELLMDILIEGLIILTASISMVSLTLRYIEERDLRVRTSNELAVSNLRGREVSGSARDELYNQINRKFEHWGLTKSEQEVAMQLLRGFDAKAIAEARFTSEKTVKNQIQNIYNKANLGGRTELMAYFLNHIFEPIS